MDRLVEEINIRIARLRSSGFGIDFTRDKSATIGMHILWRHVVADDWTNHNIPFSYYEKKRKNVRHRLKTEVFAPSIIHFFFSKHWLRNITHSYPLHTANSSLQINNTRRFLFSFTKSKSSNTIRFINCLDYINKIVLFGTIFKLNVQLDYLLDFINWIKS